MSKKKRDHNKVSQSAPINEGATEKQFQEALEKYKELYTYSTDILLAELERFNRIDEKATKFSTAFVFLLGIIGYFDRWIFEKLQWQKFPVALPSDLPMFMAAIVGLFALIFSITGLFMTVHVLRLRPVPSRPLNIEMLDFFEKNTLVTIYYGLARENSNAYNSHKLETARKNKIITRAFFLIQLTLIMLVELFLMFCLYSWT